MKYNHKKIEAKWRKYWAENPKLFAADDKSDKPKQYILDMFPYPSGDGLHTGHVESYTATDILSRYLRMSGFNVLHPQGFDAFGLPAENYAIKTKVHPAETTKKAIANFKKQMNMMGFSYDWSREVISAEPQYYKWTQWFFLLLYKNGLAFKSKGKVNWCDSCQTVLANEQAEGGVCDRCGKPVRQKDLEQWYFSITKFIEPSEAFLPAEASAKAGAKEGKKRITSGLLDGLDKIDWPDSTKAGQRNWIGKSEGAQFKMEVIPSSQSEESPANAGKGLGRAERSLVDTRDDKLHLSVFTTRLDTVFGMTFALIAPEHKLVQELKFKITNWDEAEKYITQAKKKSELQRMTEMKEKTGVELEGIKVINPFTKKEIPLFASDFVLAHYGTGAVMAVPAHDERDFDFAKKFNLPIDEVIKSVDGQSSVAKEAYTEDGVLINSSEYNGLTSAEARKKLTQWLEKEGVGEGTINYKLRDWLVSRQRYWGAPIPIIYCDKCGEVAVPEKDLPVLLPNDVDFMPTGESPLAKSKKFQNVKCPKCGGAARRESDTMDTFVCSSWYYFRYTDPHNDKEFASKEMIEKWLAPAHRSPESEGGVDLYLGGAEHTVLHLLYARFFTKVLHKLGYIDFDEPFSKMRHQGMILAPDGRKMSKSWGNIINPDDVVKEYGADALRLYEMFMGPLEEMKPWNTKGIVGVARFLERVWKLKPQAKDGKKIEIIFNKTIKKVSEDIESLKFNTAISAMMILVNESNGGELMAKEQYETFLKLFAPFAPFMVEELWSLAGHKKSIFIEPWPKYDEALTKDETINLPVQINGKVRTVLTVPADISEDDAKNIVLSDSTIIKWLEGKEPKKVIFVKGRLINIVI